MRTSMLTLALVMVVTAAQAAPAEKEVLASLDAWKTAMLKKDRAGFDKVLHPDLSYGHASGKVETKAEAVDHVVNSKATYTGINFSDTKVHVQGKTAYVTGKVDYLEKGANGKDSTTNLVVLSVWVKNGPGWQMIARQATKPTPPEAPKAAAAAPAAPKPTTTAVAPAPH
jgi:ketosteroid isomerase-like protein